MKYVLNKNILKVSAVGYHYVDTKNGINTPTPLTTPSPDKYPFCVKYEILGGTGFMSRGLCRGGVVSGVYVLEPLKCTLSPNHCGISELLW